MDDQEKVDDRSHHSLWYCLWRSCCTCWELAPSGRINPSSLCCRLAGEVKLTRRRSETILKYCGVTEDKELDSKVCLTWKRPEKTDWTESFYRETPSGHRAPKEPAPSRMMQQCFPTVGNGESNIFFFKSSTLSLTALKQKLYLKRKKTTHDSDSLVSITYGFLLREAPVPNVTRELIGRKVRNYFIVTHQRMFNARDKKKKFAIFTQEFGQSRCRCRCASLRKSPLVRQSWSWVWSQPRCGASVWKVWPKLEGWFLTGQEKHSQCCKRHVFPLTLR